MSTMQMLMRPMGLAVPPPVGTCGGRDRSDSEWHCLLVGPPPRTPTAHAHIRTHLSPTSHLSPRQLLGRGLPQVCAATHKIAVLSGDGIGPEITAVAVAALTAAGRAEGEEFAYTPALIGGAATDATGDPYPAETDAVCKASDAVLLAAIGGWVTCGGRKEMEMGRP